MTALARTGSPDEASVQCAFDAGATHLFGDRPGDRKPQPIGAVQLDRVDEALGRLVRLRPADLRNLLDALVRTIMADREISVSELEMLRAIAEALDAPMPPLVAEAEL
jgi:hypothetical protein